jgi:hypothetical protein
VASDFEQWGDFSSGFCIVRHPYDRFLSELRYCFPGWCKIQRVKYVNNTTIKNYLSSFTEKVFSCYKDDETVRDNHIRPQIDFLSTHTKILHYENYWKRFLKRKYSLDSNPPKINVPHVAIDFSDFVTKPLKNMINDFYSVDYERFGYEH